MLALLNGVGLAAVHACGLVHLHLKILVNLLRPLVCSRLLSSPCWLRRAVPCRAQIIRGENVVLLGRVDPDKDVLPGLAQVRCGAVRACARACSSSGSGMCQGTDCLVMVVCVLACLASAMITASCTGAWHVPGMHTAPRTDLAGASSLT